MAVVAKRTSSRGSKHYFPVLIFAQLWFLIVLNVTMVAVGVAMFAIRNVDRVIGVDYAFAFAAVVVTTLYLMRHESRLIERSKRNRFQHERPNYRNDSYFLRLAMGCQLVAAGIGVINISKQPVCRSKSEFSDSVPLWQVGMSCRLYQSVIAVCLVSFVLTISIFCDLEILAKDLHPRLFAFPRNVQPSPSSSTLSGSSSYPPSPSQVSDKVGLSDFVLPFETNNLTDIERERWLQRRNSLSSQKAIYPHNYRTFEARPRLRPYRRSSSTYHSPNQLGSVSEKSALLSMPDSMSRYTASSHGSSSSSTSQSFGQRGISRDDFQAKLEAKPDKKNAEANKENEFQVAKPAPAWCPVLHHAPLSADPAIRDIIISPPVPSVEGLSTQTSGTVQRYQQQLRPPSSRYSQSLRPVVPRRAPGHIGVPRMNTGTRTALRRPSPMRHHGNSLHNRSLSSSRAKLWRYDSSLGVGNQQPSLLSRQTSVYSTGSWRTKDSYVPRVPVVEGVGSLRLVEED